MLSVNTIIFAILANVFGYFVVRCAWQFGAAIYHKDQAAVVRMRGPLLKIVLYFTAFAIGFVSHGHAIKTAVILMMVAHALQMLDDHRRCQGRETDTFANLRSLFSTSW